MCLAKLYLLSPTYCNQSVQPDVGSSFHYFEVLVYQIV